MFNTLFGTKLDSDERKRKFDDEVAKLKSFRDIGEKFNYLGAKMIVVAHFRRGVDPEGTYQEPILKCDYINNLGEIKDAYFSTDELPTLIKENT